MDLNFVIKTKRKNQMVLFHLQWSIRNASAFWFETIAPHPRVLCANKNIHNQNLYFAAMEDDDDEMEMDKKEGNEMWRDPILNSI